MTLENRDLAKEGIWRKARKEDGKGQAEYVLEYLGEVFSPREFINRYCHEWNEADLRYRRRKDYPPAECIVRYNAKHEPIHLPEVGYTWKELYAATLVTPTKKVRKAKQKRDKEENKDFIVRKLNV